MSAPIDSLLMHQTSRAQVTAYLNKPAQTLALLGPAGSGKGQVSRTIASQLLGISEDKLDSCPFFRVVTKPDNKQEIPIEDVRSIISSLRLKMTRSLNNNGLQVIVVENAQSLSHEAQNALLKMLEEPSKNVFFILTAPSSSALLPTVVSRSQRITIVPVAQEEAIQYYAVKYNVEEIQKAWQLSQGNVGLMQALLGDNDDHPLKRNIELAKKFIKASKYEKLITAEQISASKDQLVLLLEALSRLLFALEHVYISKDNERQARKILLNQKLVLSLLEQTRQNTSTKLLGLKLALGVNL